MPAGFLAALTVCLVSAALTASGAGAASPSPSPGWGLPSSLGLSGCASGCAPGRRLLAARLHRTERAALRRHGLAAGAGRPAARRARPAVSTASGFEGTVSDAVTKEGVDGIEVCAYEIEAIEEGAYEEEELEPACGPVIEASGHYQLNVPVGEYFVEFFDPSRNYVTQLFSDQTLSEEEEPEPDPITVKAKLLTPKIDAALVEGGRVEGAVTALEGGEGVEGILVCAFDRLDGGCAETGSGGEYEVPGLSTGSYTLVFLVPPLPGDNYLRTSINGVKVTAGETTSGTNVALSGGGQIEGEVTAAASGSPLSKVLVCAFSEEEFEECALTDTGGAYTIERLEPGSYLVEFFDEPFFATQFYDGAPSGTPFLAEATVLSVLPPPVLGSINAAMLRFGEEAAVPPTTPPGGGAQPVTQGGPPAAGLATPPAGSVLGTKAVLPSLAAVGRVHVAGRRATVKLRCGVGPCRGSLQLAITVLRRHRAGGHTVVRHVTVVVGSGTFSLAQGAAAKVTILLTRQGRSLLASAARHPRAAKLKLVLQGAASTLHSVLVD